MNLNESPFESGWYAFDLGSYRPCGGTYCFYDYTTIPPLDEKLFRENFDWLMNEKDDSRGRYAAPQAENPITTNLKTLQESARKHDVILPVTFVTFMQNPQWHDKIPSCTACYFDLSKELIPNPLEKDTYFIRFMNDQQDVLLWYLYLKKNGASCVVVSPLLLDEPDDDMPYTDETIKHETIFCAEHFEKFIYRWWIENKIWFSLDETDNLTSAEKSYLATYQKP